MEISFKPICLLGNNLSLSMAFVLELLSYGKVFDGILIPYKCFILDNPIFLFFFLGVCGLGILLGCLD